MSNIKKSWFKRWFCCKCECNENEDVNKNSSIGGGGIKNPIKKDEEGN